MRIAHLCNSFSALSETFIYDTVTELERQGEDNHVVTLNRVNESTRPFSKVHEVPLPSKWHPRRLWHRLGAAFSDVDPYASYWPQVRPRLEAVLANLAPDVIHAHFGQMGVLVAPVVERLDIPLVVSFLGSDISVLPRSSFWRNRYAGLIKTAAFLIGISNHICNRIITLGGDTRKVRLLHLGVRIDRFNYSNPLERFDGRNVHCIHVGRLVPKKSPLHLVDAFHEAIDMTSEHLNLRLTVVGDGMLMQETRQRIQHLNLQDHITLAGACLHDEVRRHLNKSHIYTQHCRTAPNGDQEGLGVSFIEASATGLPVVTTRHNGIPDVVLDGKTGFLVDEGDSSAMADRIAYLCNHPKLWTQLGRAGRAHVEENFRLESQVHKLRKYYRTTS